MPKNVTFTARPGDTVIRWGDGSPAALPVLALTGPSTATTSVESTNFTVTAGNLTAPLVVTPTVVSGSATFNPTTVTPAPGDLVKTFTATWGTSGAKTLKAVSGSIQSNTVGVTVSDAPPPVGTAPVTMTLGTSTPHQIGVRCVLTRAVASGTSCTLQYKLPASATWTDGMQLVQIFAADVEAGAAGTSGGEAGLAPADGFAGLVFHKNPGTTYDVRVMVTEPGQPLTYTTSQSYTTRTLPAAAPAVNKPATTGTVAAVMAGLAPGDHMQLAAGTYSPLNFTISGTSGSPIYISMASGAKIASGSVGYLVTINASHLVFEAPVLQGTGVDSELTFMTSGGSPAGVYSVGFGMGTTGMSNITIRNGTITGVDQGIASFYPGSQWLVYSNTFQGNNAHNVLYTIPPGGTYPSAGWNDHGVKLPGNGNAIFQNTFSGFGDTWKVGSSTAPGGYETRWSHFYLNKVLWGADDGVELDIASGCCSAYRNWIANTGTAVSVDGTREGPFFFFENVCINQSRGPIKPTSDSYGVKVWNNTFLETNKQFTNHGLLASYATPNNRFGYQNNLLVYRGTGNPCSWAAELLSAPTWDHNAWFPDGGFEVRGAGFTPYTVANLSTAKSSWAPQFAGDVLTTSNPFQLPLVLGADYTTQYTGSFDVTLASGASPAFAGTPIVGITDGYTGAAPSIGAVWPGQGVVSPGAGSTTLNIVGNVWTPNRDGAGNVIQSDFDGLPVMQWLEVGGPGNTLRSYQQSDLPTSGGAPDNNSLTNPWCGATWDATRKRLIIQGGGHGDGHPCSNAIFEANAQKMKFARIVDRTPTAQLHAYNIVSKAFETWTGSSYAYYGVAWPLVNGNPSSAHTYHGLEYITPATMVTLGYAGNATGGLLTTWPYAICNLDTGTYNTPWWTSDADTPGPHFDASLGWAAKFIDGTKAAFVVNDFSSGLIDMATPSASRWSAQIGGANSFCTVTVGKSHSTFRRANATLIKMPGRREWASLGVSARTRIRVGAALDAAASDWTSYSDTITLTSSDGSHNDWNSTNLDEDTRPVGKLCGAGAFYDDALTCVWVQGNTTASKLYKITGIATNTWTTQRYDTPVPLYSEAGTLGNYHRHGVATFGGTKVLIRVTGVDHPMQVLRLS